MNSGPTFSERHGYELPEAEIVVRHEAPEWLRQMVVRLAYDADLRPSEIRSILCDLLFASPDPSNWSEFPNVDGEVQGLVAKTEWFQVYDLVELLAGELKTRAAPISSTGLSPFDHFTKKLNFFFRRRGVGWQLVDGRIQIRGPEVFEVAVQTASGALEQTGRPVARHEIHQSLADLSRRPQPDITGAIQHAMAALECVARDVTGEPKATLGDLLKKHPNLLPPPLDIALSKIWGFASEQGRHLRENKAPDSIEAELIVGLAGTLTTYLVKKLSSEQ